jgi:hypothetical protein
MLEDSEIDQLAVVAVAGIAAEGQKYEEVRPHNSFTTQNWAAILDLMMVVLQATWLCIIHNLLQPAVRPACHAGHGAKCRFNRLAKNLVKSQEQDV